MKTYTNIQGILINTGHLLIMGRVSFINTYKNYIQNPGFEYDKLKIEHIPNGRASKPLQTSKKVKRK